MDALAAGNLTAIFILSLKTGAILGTSWLGNRQIFGVSLFFGAFLLLLSRILGPYAAQIAWLVEEYTFPVSLAIAALFVYLGLGGNCGEGDSCQKPGVLYLGAFLPCPFCLLATAFGLILLKQRAGHHHLLPDLAFCAVFTLLLLVVAFSIRRLSGQNRSGSLKTMNSLLLLTGMTTLVMIFLVPNLVQAARMSFSGIRLTHAPVILGTWTAAGVLLAAGYRMGCRK